MPQCPKCKTSKLPHRIVEEDSNNKTEKKKWVIWRCGDCGFNFDMVSLKEYDTELGHFNYATNRYEES